MIYPSSATPDPLETTISLPLPSIASPEARSLQQVVGAVARRCTRLIPWAVLAVVGSTSGCVRVYQPMSGLHEPVLVDTRVANFQDVSLTVHCVPGDLLSRYEASALCRQVGRLFENQGAVVRTVTTVGILDDGLQGDALSERPEGAVEPTTDLTLEIRSRQVHKSHYPLSWVLSVGTFTLLPGVREATFAQDVTIRDEHGFLLVSDSLQGRLTERFGLGPWVGHKILDITVRDDDNKLTGDAAERELSTDMYGQLSQLTFNAKVQWMILQESAATAADASVVP